jgi:hypothetical protein
MVKTMRSSVPALLTTRTLSEMPPWIVVLLMLTAPVKFWTQENADAARTTDAGGEIRVGDVAAGLVLNRAAGAGRSGTRNRQTPAAACVVEDDARPAGTSGCPGGDAAEGEPAGADGRARHG